MYKLVIDPVKLALVLLIPSALRLPRSKAALFSEKGISTEELKFGFKESYYMVKKLLGYIKPEMLIAELKGKAKYYQINLNVLDSILLQQEMESSDSELV